MEYKITNGAITIGKRTILEEINFEIKNDQKIAIVGRNGCGKTTLLKSLIDNDMLETGLSLEPFKIKKISSPTIGYQTQQNFSNLEITLEEEMLKNYKNIIKVEEKIKKTEKKLESTATEKDINSYTKLLDEYKYLGGYEYKKEYDIALLKFGFKREDKEKKLSEFSGGQLTKIAFLKLLLSKPDILLLDEPTNHLDITTIEWLETYLKNYKKAVVVVSHDRMFLDNVVDIVYEIEYATLTKYKGNYTSFENQKRANYKKIKEDYEAQQKEIKRLKNIADRFRYKPSKASMALSKLQKIEQMQIIDKPVDANTKTFKTKIKPNKESSKIVLTVRDLEIGYDNIALSKVNFELYKGQKLGIIGQNGIGKSTLIKTLMGLIPKIGGKYTYGFNVEREYFDQQMEFLSNENTVYGEYEKTFPNEEPLQIRKVLGSFQFSGDEVFKQIKDLSGGEKVRLSLCKIIMKHPNLLLLDEPTNHLDLLGKEKLEEILKNYEGSILFVSHDRYFINKIADSLLIFENKKVVYYRGTYDEYIKNKKNEEVEIKKKNKPSTKIKKEKTKNNSSLIRKAEKEIDALETKKKKYEELLFQTNYAEYEKIASYQKEIDKLEEKLLEKMDEWERLN